MTERDKVLKGNYYSPFTPALTQDRENCMAAIRRFNNATNSSSTPATFPPTSLFIHSIRTGTPGKLTQPYPHTS